MAILTSLKLWYAYQIYKGNKTLEIRKSSPKNLPQTNYFYITTSSRADLKRIPEKDRVMCENWLGKIPFEFTLKRIDTIEICDPDILINGKQCKQANLQKECQVSINNIMSYIGYGNDHDGWGRDWDKGYLWHIDNLKIYDKPKELSDFVVEGDCNNEDCQHCKYFYCGRGWLDGSTYDDNDCKIYGYKPITRPPQSWCYVTKEKSNMNNVKD